MSEMTDEQWVISKFPEAELFELGSVSGQWAVYRTDRPDDTLPIGQGETAVAAWKDAATHLGRTPAPSPASSVSEPKSRWDVRAAIHSAAMDLPKIDAVMRGVPARETEPSPYTATGDHYMTNVAHHPLYDKDDYNVAEKVLLMWSAADVVQALAQGIACERALRASVLAKADEETDDSPEWQSLSPLRKELRLAHRDYTRRIEAALSLFDEDGQPAQKDGAV